mmetsp:Transcript_23/g.24  ORF Transcript_23/g.24 Transcript_23/m.24 type:complete len:476 (-) Transcript_23:110-1537(-)
MGNISTAVDQLHDAAKNGDTKTIRSLLYESEKIEVNITEKRSQNITALHHAIKSGHLDTVEALLEYGANPNAINNDTGESPLHVALARDDHEVCALLLQYGADVRVENKYGESCLSNILKTSNGSLINQLLKFSSSIEFAKSFSSYAAKHGKTTHAPLDELKLLPTAVLLETECIPSYKICRDFLVSAEKLKEEDRILFISHRWSSSSSPDPAGIHYNMVIKFLQDTSYLHFEYVWIDYACLNFSGFTKGDDSDKPYVIRNVSTAILLSTDILILPALVESQPGVVSTDLQEFLQRGWCRMEFLLSILSGSAVHITFCVYQENFTSEEDGDFYFHWGEGPEFIKKVGHEASMFFRDTFGYQPDLSFHENWVLAADSINESNNMLFWSMLVLQKAEGLFDKSKIWTMNLSIVDAGRSEWDPVLRVQANPFWAALQHVGNLDEEEDRFTLLNIYFVILLFCNDYVAIHNPSSSCAIS